MESSLRVGNLPEPRFKEHIERTDEHSHGISWSAVIGGAFVTAAISLIMLALGAGFGLSTISPWSNAGASASTVGAAAIIWLIVTQVVACALGGYLAGRLRTKWHAVHTDEVYFRDTANGFLVWAVALVITVTFLMSAAASMVGNSAVNNSAPANAATTAAADPRAYFVDRLFRTETPRTEDVGIAVRAEAGRILVNKLRSSDADGADEAYLAKLIATKTGVSQTDAEKRVSQVVAEARQAEDDARSTVARLLLWIFLALLIGAFSASFSATLGGRQRDHVKVI